MENHKDPSVSEATWFLTKTRTSVYKRTLGKEYLAACRIALKGGSRKDALRAISLALYYSTKIGSLS